MVASMPCVRAVRVVSTVLRYALALLAHLIFYSTVMLDLENNKLTGMVPSEIGVLTNLGKSYLFSMALSPTRSLITVLLDIHSAASLQLYNNELTGAIPSEIGLLTMLST